MLRPALVAAVAAIAIPLLATVACVKCCRPTSSLPVEPDAAAPDAPAPDAAPPICRAEPVDAACGAPEAGPAPASTFTIIDAPQDAGPTRCVAESEVVRAYVVLQRPCPE